MTQYPTQREGSNVSVTHDNLCHLVITRFCIRYMERASSVVGPSKSMKIDPLEEANVNFRSFIIRTVTFESIRNQTSTNFDWVILVEPDLNTQILADLRGMTDPYSNMHIHTLHVSDDLGSHEWLA